MTALNYLHLWTKCVIVAMTCCHLFDGELSKTFFVVAGPTIVPKLRTVSSTVDYYYIYPLRKSTRSPLALLSGTLRTYQKAACDEEWINLKCPFSTTISIQLAKYGKTVPGPNQCHSNPSIHPSLMDVVDPSNIFTCQWPNSIQYSVLQAVVGYCQKKPNCKFQTSPRSFGGGDPCPQSRKFVEVAWKCRPSEFRSAMTCADESLELSCNKSYRLAIYSANYGRTEYESVRCPQPRGVQEESCLASYATENVMQLCHGKRRCALVADRATFGSPCKPESRMYLKVIFTCVPRRVLLEKFQGEAEPDEMFDDELNLDEDSIISEGVVEQPSIYSPDRSKSPWSSLDVKTTETPSVPITTHHSNSDTRNTRHGNSDDENLNAKSSAVLKNSESVHDERNRNSSHDAPLFYLISEGVRAYDFISNNPEKFYLYVSISVATGLFLVVLVLLGKLCIQRKSLSSDNNSSQGRCPSKPSSSSVGPIVSSGLSDVDELSLVLDPSEYIDLPSILRRSATTEESLIPTSVGGPITMANTTLGRSSDGVRFTSALLAQEGDLNPKCFNNRDSNAANIHFYYE